MRGCKDVLVNSGKQSPGKTKKALRQEMAHKRSQIGDHVRERSGQRACFRLFSLPEVLRAKRIGLYAALCDELPTRPVFDFSISQGLRVAFPIVLGQQLEFRWISQWDDLTSGYRGILEPKRGGAWAALDRLDVLIVPGVCFDTQGQRLGRGGGFYDRLLESGKVPSCVIGYGYDFSILSHIPTDAGDQKMNMIVTEDQAFRL